MKDNGSFENVCFTLPSVSTRNAPVIACSSFPKKQTYTFYSQIISVHMYERCGNKDKPVFLLVTQNNILHMPLKYFENGAAELHVHVRVTQSFQL